MVHLKEFEGGSASCAYKFTQHVYWTLSFFPWELYKLPTFFFLHCTFQKAISQEEWFQFNLQIICCFFFPQIKQMNNQLTLIQGELGTMYGHTCGDPDLRSAALGCSVSAV